MAGWWLVVGGWWLVASGCCHKEFDAMARRGKGRKGGVGFRWRDCGWRGRGLGALDTLILAFSREGRRDPLGAVWAWFLVAGLGSPSGSAGVSPPRAALARDTLILAFSREGRRDPLAAVWAWFWVAGLARRLGARASRPPRCAWARRAFILALSHEGLTGALRLNLAYAATALARVTLTLALSHEGRGDPLAAVWAWFWVASHLDSRFRWNDGVRSGNDGMRSGNDGVRRGGFSAMRGAAAAMARRPVPARRGRRSGGWRRSCDGTRLDLPAVYLYVLALAGR